MDFRGLALFDTNEPTLESTARYFSATAFAGHLYVGGVPDRGPWDTRALAYWDEGEVDLILNPRVGPAT